MRVLEIEFRPLTWVLLLVLIGLAVVAMAAPSDAGTVYTWTTDDGTTAFTDDPKRIPARYKDAAKRQQTGTLKNYERLTVSETTTKTPYEERLASRLGALRESKMPAVSAGPPSAHPEALNIGIGDKDQLSVPIGGEGAEAAPLEIDEYRVRLPNRARVGTNIGTQNARVVRRGDEIISVTVSPRTSRPVSEKDFPGSEQLGAND